MTKKMAVFVEGDTERAFVRKLLEELGGINKVSFKTIEQRSNRFTVLEDDVDNRNYYVLIVNCRSDERVKSEILDRRESLIKQNFQLILGLRDLYPSDISEIKNVEMRLQTGVPTKDISIHILLAVMEIEAWFLQEENHYEKIDKDLNLDLIKKELGYDPARDSADKIPEPAKYLHEIYSLVGKAYKKTNKQISRTVDHLDYENIYLNLPGKLPHLNIFIRHLDGYFR